MHSNSEKSEKNVPIHAINSHKTEQENSFSIEIPEVQNVQNKPQESTLHLKKLKPKNQKLHKVTEKIWSLLEIASLSAIVFVLLFFVLNFDSYSKLFTSKVEQIRSSNTTKVETQDNPLKNSAQVTNTNQPEFLKVLTNQDLGKKNIGDLNLEIMPPDNRIYIPRIKQNVPIISVSSEKLIKRQWSALEKQIQTALQDGVVHYPGTANPGEIGNTVITGHSSYFPWDPGRFKDVFALLHQVSVGEQIEVYYNQKKYVYRVKEKLDVTPDKVDVLLQGSDEKLTLITCTPVGTNLRRLVIVAEPIK